MSPGQAVRVEVVFELEFEHALGHPEKFYAADEQEHQRDQNGDAVCRVFHLPVLPVLQEQLRHRIRVAFDDTGVRDGFSGADLAGRGSHQTVE